MPAPPYDSDVSFVTPDLAKVVGLSGAVMVTFADSLTQVALSESGETITVSVLREGKPIEIPVELAARRQFDVE